MMRQKLLSILTLLVLSVAPASMLATAPAYADCGTADSSKGQVLQGLGQSGSDCSDSGVKKAIKAIVEVLSIIVGIAAIIVIIVSGLKYITSAGDSGKAASARQTLIYALIGIAIAALAQFLVHFVLTQTTK